MKKSKDKMKKDKIKKSSSHTLTQIGVFDKSVEARPKRKQTLKKLVEKPIGIKRRICNTYGCRKIAVVGSVFCPICGPKNDGPNVVVKVTELEALRFAMVDTEARNDSQAIQLIDYKIAEVKKRVELELNQLSMQRRQLVAAIEARKPAYQELVKTLAEKYGIDDTSKMTIDPDTGVIRDLSKT